MELSSVLFFPAFSVIVSNHVRSLTILVPFFPTNFAAGLLKLYTLCRYGTDVIRYHSMAAGTGTYCLLTEGKEMGRVPWLLLWLLSLWLLGVSHIIVMYCWSDRWWC